MTLEQWVAFCDEYHAARLSAADWAALSPEMRRQAITSALTHFALYEEHKNYKMAVAEQALWLTTESATNSINDYSSVSVSTTGVSVGFGRSASKTGQAAWMSPLAWALLKPQGGGWGVGRVV